MAGYLRPDVYVQRQSGGASPIQAVGTSTAGFIGTTPRGSFEPQLVTSWTEFITLYARGLSSPFAIDSDLVYAVYGFFLNGGGSAYIQRVAGSTKAKATIVVEGLTVTALEEGSWGNGLQVEVKANSSAFDIILTLDGNVVETFTEVSTVDGITSNYVTLSGDLSAGKSSLTGGKDGLEVANDTMYLEALKNFDVIEEISLIAIPGQTSPTVLKAVLDYAENRGDCMPVLDAPKGEDVTTVITSKKQLGGKGAIYYPWGKVVDPATGKLRLVPPSGHVCGIYSRTDKERGVHKAPAGVEAVVRGFVETERKLSSEHLGLLNSNNINAIVSRPNQGIVVWGARLLAPHLDRTYVSDLRLDIAIEEALYNGTQWTVFEPNDSKLWSTVTAQVKAFLYNYWVEGALFGDTPEEAFFVKCDAELNTQEVRDAGKLIIEVGYAKKKPTEFTIIQITQKQSN